MKNPGVAASNRRRRGWKMSLEGRANCAAGKRILVEADQWTPWNKGQKMNYTKDHLEKIRKNWKTWVNTIRKPSGHRFTDTKGYVWVK